MEIFTAIALLCTHPPLHNSIILECQKNLIRCIKQQAGTMAIGNPDLLAECILKKKTWDGKEEK